MLLYRASAGTPGKRVLLSPAGKIEALGAGQHFTAFGRHHTGAALEWLSGSPLNIHVECLPTISEDQLTAFFEAARAIVGADATETAAPADGERTSTHGQAGDLTDIASAVAAIPNSGPADWDAWNRVGMALWAATEGDEDGRALFHDYSEQNPAYDPDTTDGRWDALTGCPPDRIGAGTLYHLARSADPTWARPSQRPTGGAEFDRLPDDQPTRRRWLKTGDFDWQNSRPVVIDGLLAERDVGMIFGAPGAGKSLIGPYMAAMVAQGRPFFGMDTEPGLTLYVASEDESGMTRRAEALVRRHGDLVEFHLSSGISSLVDPAEFARLLDDVRTMKPRLVIVDTLAMAFPGISENEAADMGRVVHAARQLTAWGAAIVIIHHDTKSAGGTPRGHSLLNGALDVAILLEPADERTGIIRGRLTKNRNGACTGKLAFRIGVETLGHDQKGKPVTAAFAEEVAEAQPASVKLSPREHAALTILQDMAAGGTVTEAAWLAECDDKRVCASDDPKNRRDVMRRTYTGLLAKRAVACGSGTVWLPGNFGPVSGATA